MEPDDDIDYCTEDLNKTPPFPEEFADEATAIESLEQCFQRRYNACPAFYHDTLFNTIDAAFKSTVIQDRRPVLVYIHHDGSILRHLFCSTIFCSDKTIEYLLENYLVWPWDITHESNQMKLANIWKNIFSAQFTFEFSVEQYPMLIGIMRRSAKDKDWSSTSEYQSKILLKGDIIQPTGEKSDIGTLYSQLCIFRDKFHENEQNLSFDFSKMTGLCWGIIFEITKYLTLNDAVNAFTDKIFPLFDNYNSKLHLRNPTNGVINRLYQKIKPEQIVSIHIGADKLSSLIEHPPFTNVISLGISNPSMTFSIHDYESHFPNLYCLSFWYDNEIRLNFLSQYFDQSVISFKRLEIHCPGVLYHQYFDQYSTVRFPNEHFLLDIRHGRLSSVYEYFAPDDSTFLAVFTKFISTMNNIRYVRLVINTLDINTVHNLEQWNSLLNNCPLLKKITVEKFQDTGFGDGFVQKAMEIIKSLHRVGSTFTTQSELS